MIVYRIINKINGKEYIGQTIKTLKRRWTEHCCAGSILYKAIKKYGKENFTQSIIHTCDNIEDLNLAEEYFIEYYNTMSPNGYNLHTGGNNHMVSDETRKKMSEAGKGKTWTEERKKKHSESISGEKHPNFGKTATNETRDKISKAGTGRKHAETSKIKIGESKKGVPRSEEVRRNISVSSTGKTVSEEVKQKISKATKGENNPNFGNRMSKQSREKISEANRGEPFICLNNGKTYYTLQSAGDELDINITGISRTLRGKQRGTNGYRFKYLREAP
jgi:group I intron endonuclease